MIRFPFNRSARLCAAAALALSAVALPARAEWRVAESARFVVYSESSERALRAYVQKLESYDRALRLQLNLDPDGGVGRKLPVYMVRSQAELAALRPDAGRDLKGYYLATDEEIFAVALPEGIGDDVLMHEYAHHFMMQNASTGYPSWFIEGFAEYYMTADIEANRVHLGKANENRVYWLTNSPWIPLDQLLTKTPGQVEGTQRLTYYPMAWLLTHWFLSDDTRRQQLGDYLTRVRGGGDRVTSMQEATGLSLSELRAELDRHLHGRLTYYRINADFPRADVTVRPLDETTGDLLLLGLRLKTPSSDEARAEVIERVRRESAPYANTSAGRLIQGHAELHFGDEARGEEILKALVADEPQNVEALQLLASHRLQQIADRPEDAETLFDEANVWIQQAKAVAPTDYRTLMLVATAGQSSPDYPRQQDLDAWILAFRAAPQLGQIRIQAAQALLRRNRVREAIFLLEPVAGDPHGGSGSEYARRLIDQANGGPPAGAPEPETAPAD